MTCSVDFEPRVTFAEGLDRRETDRLVTGSKFQELHLSLPSNRRFVSPVLALFRELSESVGALTDRELLSVSIALEEAISNAIIHGNLEVSSKLRDLEDESFERMIAFRLEKTPFGSRRVQIEARFSETEVTFTITDEGPGFDIAAIPDPTEDENVLLTHGRGLFLMRSFMDNVTHNANGNQVTLVKRKTQSV